MRAALFVFGCILLVGCSGRRVIDIRGGTDGTSFTVDDRTVRIAPACSQVSVENLRIRATSAGHRFEIEGASIQVDGRPVRAPQSWKRVEISCPGTRVVLRFDGGEPIEWTGS